MLNFAPDRVELVIEMEIHVFTESTTVIIPIRSAVSESFENNIGLNENVTDSRRTNQRIDTR